MPLYEYRCQSCDQVFEVMQKFADAPLTVHEACGGTVERLISAPAFQFKGSGWYITDYARSNGAAGKDNKSAESKAGDGSKSEASKPDSAKSASKTESKPASST
jgi:putative FmdB family regulatory protein